MSASPVKFLINTVLKLTRAGSINIFWYHLFSGFLWSFENSRVQEQEAMTQTEENIISLLELCSRVRRNGKEWSNRMHREM